MGNGKPSYLLSVFFNKCPRCREGKIFETGNAYAFKSGRYMQMKEKCPVCGQPTEIEVGFYYGTGFVSYGLTVAISGATFVAWWVIFGFSIYDNSLFWWLGFNAVLLIALQPVLMRFSRTLWLSWFVKYDPGWKDNPLDEPERAVEGFMEKNK